MMDADMMEHLVSVLTPEHASLALYLSLSSDPEVETLAAMCPLVRCFPYKGYRNEDLRQLLRAKVIKH